MPAKDPNNPTTADMYAVFLSIDTTLKHLLGLAEARNQKPAQPKAEATYPKLAQPPTAIAPDSDLDSQYGDETLKFKPRDWTGDDYTGKRMSEAPVALLTLYADAVHYFGEQKDKRGDVDDQGRAKSFYEYRTESRARGWAVRISKGWTRPASVNPFTAAETAPAAPGANPFDDEGDVASL